MLVIYTGASPYVLQKVVIPVLRGNPSIKYRFKKELSGVEPVHTEKGTPSGVSLVLGTKRLNELQASGILPKGRTITSLRSRVLGLLHGRPLLVSYDPAIMNDDYSKLTDLQIDLSMAMRLESTGNMTPKLGEYVYVDSFTDAIQGITAQHKKTGVPVPVSLDLETWGLDPYHLDKHIVSVSLTYKRAYSEIIRFESRDDPLQPAEYITPKITPLYDEAKWEIRNKKVWNQLDWLLRSEIVSLCGANLKYDLCWMAVHWNLECNNFKFDTTIVGSLLDENRSNSLNTHAKLYTELGGYDDKFNQVYDKGNMPAVPSEDLLTYAGGDTDAAYRVAQAQKRELSKDSKLTRFYIHLLKPAMKEFELMEREGMLIDEPYFREVGEQLRVKLQNIQLQAMKAIPYRLVLKYGGPDKFSLNRAAIVGAYLFGAKPLGLGLKPKLFTEKTKAPSTAIEHLSMFSEHPKAREFLDLLSQFNSVNKTLGTYVDGFLKHLRPDGRFHATAIMYRGDYGDEGDSGTVTGRLAFKDPALQTTPKHTIYAPMLRKGFIAPEGYVLVNWDYSQGELRIMACVANESNMLESYREGIDLHLKTGASLQGYELSEALEMMVSKDTKVKALIKSIRQGGKAGNFGLIYGMQAEGYMNYAWNTYMVKISLEKATKQRNAFFSLYPGLLDYHREYKFLAHKQGYVRSPLGRVRHLPLISSRNREMVSKSERQAINSPIQSTLSDMIQLSMVEFNKAYGRTPSVRFCLMTHDSLTAYVKEDEVGVWGPRVKEVMENLPLHTFGWEPQISFPVDWEYGPNLAEQVAV